MRILVIDDDERLAKAVQRSMIEYDVEVETDPARALARFEAADADGAPFEVVVCDLMMPGMSGFEVLGRLRTNPEPPMSILMSASEEVVEAAAVADRILLKPFRVREIVEAIDRIRAHREKSQTVRLRRVRAGLDPQSRITP